MVAISKTKRKSYKDVPLPRIKYHFDNLIVESMDLGEIVLDSSSTVESIVPIVKIDREGIKSYWIPKLIDYFTTLSNTQRVSKEYNLQFFYLRALKRIYERIQNGDF